MKWRMEGKIIAAGGTKVPKSRRYAKKVRTKPKLCGINSSKRSMR